MWSTSQISQSRNNSNGRSTIRIWFMTFILLYCNVKRIDGRIHDYISLTYSCYESNEDINIHFSTQMATMQNWVAIYPEEEEDYEQTNDSNNGEENRATTPIESKWSCGSHDTSCQDEPGRALFTNLASGSYIAHLRGIGYHGRTIELYSEPFVVKAKGQSCDDWVAMDNAHYTSGDDIVVSFHHKYPDEGDAIAIFPATTVNNAREQMKKQRFHNNKSNKSNYNDGLLLESKPALWMWTCGDQECRDDQISHGKLSFGTWTLQTGEYIALLGQLLPNGNFLANEDSFEFQFSESIDCTPSIQVLHRCYSKGQSAMMQVERCTPLDDDENDLEYYTSSSSSKDENDRIPKTRQNHSSNKDKIAIYYSNTTIHEGDHLLERPVAWSYVSSSHSQHQHGQHQHHHEGREDNEQVLLDNSSSSSSSSEEDTSVIPANDLSNVVLDIGKYKAVLIQNNPGGKDLYHVSDTFQVTATNNGCRPLK